MAWGARPKAPTPPRRANESLRVTLLVHSYWPESSPPQRRWTALLQEMCAAGWQIDVVTPVAHAPAGLRQSDPETAGRAFRRQKGQFTEVIRRVPYLPHRNSQLARFVDHCFSAVMSVPLGMLTRRPDVVIATAPSLPILAAGFLLARLRGVPLIVEMRDAWPDLARDSRMVQGRIKSVVEVAVDFIQHRADLVVTVTEGFADTLRSRGVKSVATISNGLHIDTIPALVPPEPEREVFEALYLGNHGASQRLEVVIRASAIVGHSMHLHLVGDGTRKPALQKLARELNAPVTFHPSLHGKAVLDRYASADTCIVSLRDDWKSFDTTVPSKTYEVLAVGRHVTAIVIGEAARIIEDADAGDIVASAPEAVAQLWRELAADRSRLVRDGASRQWVKEHADYSLLAERYMALIARLLNRAPVTSR